MRKCDSCGKLYQESKDVFCPHCGAVAHKQCTHTSSFDSQRYDRGELYKYNNTQYKNTTYNKGYEPHAQRKEQPSSSQSNSGYGEKLPQINLPDLKTVLSKGKNQNGKFIGIIVICIVFAFNLITGLVNSSDMDHYYDNEPETEYVDVNEFYTVVDKATIEMVDADDDFKTFTLEISGMGFDDALPEAIHSTITSDDMGAAIVSEDTFVEMMICDFSKPIVEGNSYDNAIDDSYFYSGKQVDDKCKYEFIYRFDYDEIVHIVSGVNFYLDDGKTINAELPFSAFSVSKDGEITYYNSYASDDTAWNTVFSECSNEQEINNDLCVNFGVVESDEGVSENGE